MSWLAWPSNASFVPLSVTTIAPGGVQAGSGVPVAVGVAVAVAVAAAVAVAVAVAVGAAVAVAVAVAVGVDVGVGEADGSFTTMSWTLLLAVKPPPVYIPRTR